MSGRFLYPRLTDRAAMQLREALLATPMDKAGDTHSLSHPAAYFAAVGGERVDEETLHKIRRSVLEALEPWLRRARAGQLHRGNRAEMDGPLGAVLHETMDIIPADAAHDGTWSFLSLVLLPEVTKARFPDGHVNRWLGRPRNALRRTWWRQHVLGDMEVPSGATPLGEDELVGLFERPTLASDARLVRLLARRILEHRGPDRSHFARRLSKRVLAELAFTETALLDDAELEALVEEAVRSRSASPRTDGVEVSTAGRTEDKAAEERAPWTGSVRTGTEGSRQPEKRRGLARLLRPKAGQSGRGDLAPDDRLPPPP